MRTTWLLTSLCWACAATPAAAPPAGPPTAASAEVPEDSAPAAASGAAAARDDAIDGPQLIWVVSPAGKSPHADVEQFQVELVLRQGAAEERVALGTFPGGLTPNYQRVCHAALEAKGLSDQIVYPATPNDVGKIAFMYAGSDILSVRQAAPRDYEVIHEEDSHAECDPSCTLPAKVLTTVRFSFRTPPTERIELVSASGAHTSYRCDQP